MRIGAPLQSVFVSALWLAAAAQCMLLCGCSGRETAQFTPLVHNGVSDVWPDSIDLHNGVMLCAVGDTLLQLRVEGNVLRNIPLGAPRAGRFLLETDFPVVDALVRMEASADARMNWTQYTPYELYLNPLPATDAVQRLESRLKNGLIVPEESRRYGWPVVNENPMWLLAACEVFKAGGNRRWLETVGDVARNVMDADCFIRRDRSTGLFRGIPRYMAGGDGPFARWMCPIDIFGVQTLGVNGAYWGVLDAMNGITRDMVRKNDNAHLPELPVDADSLRHAVNRELWLPGEGCYSAFIYGGGAACPLQLHASDNIAQAMAILTGLPSEAMRSVIVRNTPVAPDGIAVYTPAVGVSRDLLLAKVLWGVAAMRSGNTAACDMAFGTLLDAVGSSVLWGSDAERLHCENALSGFILRGLLGISFAVDGLKFSPAVPQGLTGTKTVKGLRYRRSRLDIKVEGTGNTLLSFSIDGKVVDEPFFPASSEGHHSISIVVGGEDALAGENGNKTRGPDPGTGVSIDQGIPLPPSPVVEWSAPRHATLLPEASTSRQENHRDESVSVGEFVYIDGVLEGELQSHNYELFESERPVTVQFVSVSDNRFIGYSSRPYLYVPDGCRHLIYLPEYVKSGTKVIEDKRIAARFVESDRARNRTLAFPFDAGSDGWYVLDVHYASGLGLVNRRRRTGVRTLWINESMAGVLVFPQQMYATAETSSAGDWQTLTAFSNQVKVWLNKGMNKIEIRFCQPSPVYVDPTANSVVADFVRIIPAPGL